jgi:hypothetical protein
VVVIHEGAVDVKSRSAVFDVRLRCGVGDHRNRPVVEGVSGLCPGLVVALPGEAWWVKRLLLAAGFSGAGVGA